MAKAPGLLDRIFGSEKSNVEDVRDLDNDSENNDNSDEDNSRDNDIRSVSIWNEPEVDEADKSNFTDSNNVQQVDTSTPEEKFQNYIKGLNLRPEFSSELIQTLIDERDPEKFSQLIGDSFEKVYAATIQDAGKLMDQKITKAVDEAVNKSRTVFNTDKFVEKMKQKLPFVDDPNILPVAQSVASSLMTKHGATQDQAIEGVNRFFRKVGEELGPNIPPSGRPGSRQIGGNAEGKEPDWLNLLSGE